MSKKEKVQESAGADTMQDAATETAPVCKRCGKPITNPHGDNGCGSHTDDSKTVTNCKA